MEDVVKRLTQVSRWLSWAGGVLFLASAVLISLDVAFRALFRSTLFESFELSSYAFAIATALGLAYTLTTKGHIRIEVIYNLFGMRVRAVLDVVALGSLSVVATVLVYWCLQTVMQNAAMGARSNSSLAMPLVAPQSVWLLGMVWFAIVSFVLAVTGFAWLLRRKFAEVHQALGVGSLQEEISANVDISTIQPPKAG